ncbi:MAG: carbohydrate ABC transporter substrate-binding protein [Deltaproteobacteria bacterium]|nr:carbohydrate ABC transporter substrate-binding protein [Deltaproteobacteria bacterium]
MKKQLLANAILLTTVLALATCSKSSPQSAEEEQTTAVVTDETATSAEAKDNKIGGTVSVLGLWGGAELEIFNNLVKPFEERTGIKVEYEGTRDLDAVLTTRVEAGNPPDLAVLPNPGKMAELARSGKLIDLSSVIDMAKMKEAYAQSWIDLGSVDGKLVGIFTKASLKGLVWYNPQNLKEAAIEIPESFDKLIEVSKVIAKKGKKPWAIGVESGAASGWVGTDWIESILLGKYGAQKYVEWYKGKLAWTSDEMKSVFKMWGQIVTDKKMVYGGKKYILATNFGEAFIPVFKSPSKAMFHFQAAFIQSFIQKQFADLKPGSDYNFFALPPADPQNANAIEIAGDLFGMLKQTPQAAAFIEYMTSPKAQSFWVKAANGISPNKQVSLDDYPDPLSKHAAEIMTKAEATVFDASDMMPGKMNNEFWSAILHYIEKPAKLNSILESLEKVRKEVYKQ